VSAERTGTGRASSKTIARWTAYLEELHVRIAHCFSRPEVRERAYCYLTGLLGEVRRKNSWQMAEAIGEVTPRGVQHLLNDVHWDPDAVRDDLREYVVEHLGDEESGVLIVDETGFLKKGEKSVGVARQYTGTAGKKENCQVGVFVCYVSKEGAPSFGHRAPRPKTGARRRSFSGIPGRYTGSAERAGRGERSGRPTADRKWCAGSGCATGSSSGRRPDMQPMGGCWRQRAKRSWCRWRGFRATAPELWAAASWADSSRGTCPAL
jgi:hypothetical protein